MDHNEGLCPHGDCMNPLTMANKGMTMYFFVRELALVLELPRRNWQSYDHARDPSSIRAGKKIHLLSVMPE